LQMLVAPGDLVKLTDAVKCDIMLKGNLPFGSRS
jgi:hypothetical protein